MNSIEWLIEELTPSIALQQKYIDELKEKAKKMHKKEIVNTYIIADSESTIEDAEHNAEKYYERNFKGSAESQGYICPQTKKQCKDECCVSAEDCHIQAGIGVIFDCKDETTSSQTEKSDFDKPFVNFAKQYFKPKK